MRLIIGNQRIALPADATMSMERSSPALNQNVGSFSYPFPIPTKPNQRILGWPGDLNRKGDIPDKSFILEDYGIQIIRGEVEYDTITEDEIGIILKSGMTEFYALINSQGSNLCDLDLGQEAWFGNSPVTLDTWEAKLSQWDIANRSENNPILVAPFRFTSNFGNTVTANKHSNTGTLTNNLWNETDGTYYFYMIQFRAWYLIEKIFESKGYTILRDELKDGDFANLVIMSRPFGVTKSAVEPEAFPNAGSNDKMVYPAIDNLVYANLMPEVTIIDFLDAMRLMMGLSYDIDDLKKEVKIIFLKTILKTKEEGFDLPELKGWQHKEPGNTGYSIIYQSQNDKLDDRADYTIIQTVETYAEIPAALENYVIHVTQTGRDYIGVKNEDQTLTWSQIGRLKPYSNGDQSTKIEINVMIPQSVYTENLFTGPSVSLLWDGPHFGMVLYTMPEIYVSYYRGMVSNALITAIPFQISPIPFLSADKYIPTETIEISPHGLYNSVYIDYLTWKTSGLKEFVKFVKLTLPQLLSLGWDKTYTVNGVRVILSKINYDLPFTGIIQITGYVV